MMAQPTGTTITGVVENVNERGIKLNGGWLNVSKFAPIALPMRGAHVALEVKDGRWIQRCDVLDGEAGGFFDPGSKNSRERTITRLAVLKAAAAFAARRPEAKSTDVPLVAEAWLRWVVADGGRRMPNASVGDRPRSPPVGRD